MGDRQSITNLASVMGLAKRMKSQRQDAVKGEGVKLALESKAYIVSDCIVGERAVPLILALMCHFLLCLLPFCSTRDLPSFYACLSLFLHSYPLPLPLSFLLMAS